MKLLTKTNWVLLAGMLVLGAGCCGVGSPSTEQVKNSLVDIAEGIPADTAEKMLRDKKFEIVPGSSEISAFWTTNCFLVEDRVTFSARIDEARAVRDIHIASSRSRRDFIAATERMPVDVEGGG